MAQTEMTVARGRVGRGQLARNSRHRAIDAHARLCRLSVRQRQVLDCIAEGNLNKQIAALLQINETTVKMHRAKMLNALQVRSSAAAIRIAVEASFLSR